MQYIIEYTDPRHISGIAKQVAAYNAGQIDSQTLTVEQYLAKALPVETWADEHAPASIPLGEWLQRWTDDERAGAFSLGGQNAQVKALWLQMLSFTEVQPDNPDLLQGVPLVCAALEQMGVIAAGQSAVRVAAICAF